MLRTQVLLEVWQYRSLKEQAKRSGRSLSAVIRDIISTIITPPATRTKRLSSIQGILKDTQVSGKEHDRYLYHKS